MYLIVVGAGQIGMPLLEIATEDGHEVVVIESNPRRADEAAEKLDCLVLEADATSKESLEEAGAGEADALIAITDRDTVNIMVCLLAKELEIPQIVSVVRDPEHLNIFRQIGVEIMENPQRLIAEHLYRQVKQPSVTDYMRLGTGGEVFEVEVAEGAPIAGMTLAQAAEEDVLSDELLVVAVERPDAEPTMARGGTRIEAGDRLVVYAASDVDHDLMDVFGSE